MSFSSPLWLLAALLIPLGLAAYLRARRTRRRYALRFPAVASAQLALATEPGWQRQLPATFALTAIAVLAVALAQPHVSYSAPTNEASIMLVIDHSGSMASTDVAPTRLQAVQRAANTFIDQLPAAAKVGVVGFGTTPDVVQAPSTDHASARGAVDGMSAGGSTATGNALQLALQELRGSEPKHPPSAIVLLSDGAANAGIDPVTEAQVAKQERIPIFTVALGTPDGTLQEGFGQAVAVPPDPQLMAQIAAAAGGRSYQVQNADLLNSIYQKLGSQLGHVTRKREVTAEFAAGGLILILLAAVGSARWGGLLP
jgi:Ca-activated chloride channel homolog